MAISTHQLDSNQDIGSLFFKHPSNIFISGRSGKTEFVKKIIEFKEDLFDVTRNGKNLIISYKNVRGQTSNSFIVTDPSVTHLVIFYDMLGDKDEEKLSCGLHESDIIEMQVWCTSHKTYFNKVNLLAPSV